MIIPALSLWPGLHLQLTGMWVWRGMEAGLLGVCAFLEFVRPTYAYAYMGQD